MMATRTLRTRDDLVHAGWTEVVDDGFAGHVGPLWHLVRDQEATFGFFAGKKHKNRAGIVHGGMLATLADRALGMTARLSDPSRMQATIELNIQYIDVARMGEFVTATGRLLRQTSTLAFLSGQLEANGRLIGHASGIWRIAIDRQLKRATVSPSL